MNILIGDIGNSITKICLVDIKTFKLKKIFTLNSSTKFVNNYLKKNFKKIIKKKII